MELAERVITGKILNPDGSPCAGALIKFTVTKSVGAGGEFVPRSSVFAKTNSDGALKAADGISDFTLTVFDDTATAVPYLCELPEDTYLSNGVSPEKIRFTLVSGDAISIDAVYNLNDAGNTLTAPIQSAISAATAAQMAAFLEEYDKDGDGKPDFVKFSDLDESFSITADERVSVKDENLTLIYQTSKLT